VEPMKERKAPLLPTIYKILCSILVSRLNLYVEEIIGDHQCGFRRNRSATDHTFCIRHILGGKWEYDGRVQQLFMYFDKSYDTVRSEILYNLLIACSIPLKLVALIKIFLNESYSNVGINKNLPDAVLIQNGVGRGDALSSFLFNFALVNTIRNTQEIEEGIECNTLTAGLC
jgi:hypothetical protein